MNKTCRNVQVKYEWNVYLFFVCFCFLGKILGENQLDMCTQYRQALKGWSLKWPQVVTKSKNNSMAPQMMWACVDLLFVLVINEFCNDLFEMRPVNSLN